MSGAHTPGPLAVEAEPFSNNDYRTEVVIPDRAGQPGVSVATCHHNWQDAAKGERRISWNEAQANARLFAAAPELLEALIFLADVARATPGFLSPLALGNADDAIAKAKGGAA